MSEKAIANQNAAWYPIKVALNIFALYCNGIVSAVNEAGRLLLVIFVKTEIMIAVPTEVATWRMVLLTAVPCEIKL